MDYSQYINRKPFHTLRCSPSGFRAYQDEEFRLRALFKRDALEDVGLTGHVKADKAFDLAWAEGHVDGYSSVYDQLVPLADLLLD